MEKPSRPELSTDKNASVCILEAELLALTAMLIAPSQCGPDEMVVGFQAALRWAYAPNG